VLIKIPGLLQVFFIFGDCKMKRLRIIYMGTPEFAVAPLRAILQEGFDVAAVITAADKPAGRGRSLKQSPVKEFALSHNLPVLQPLNLKDQGFIDELRSYEANLQVVVAFRMLPEAVWQMPALGTFNLHASLLPQYRGAAPINRAIINGETITGLTTFYLSHQIDTGNIILREKIQIQPDDTAGTLHDKLALKGAELVVSTLHLIREGSYQLTDQMDWIEPGQELKTAPKIFKDDCILHWNKPANHIHNQVRGLSPVPGAVTTLVSPQGKSYSVKIYRTSMESSDSNASNGSLETDGKSFLMVKASDGWVMITELQMEGKKRLRVDEFLRGFVIDSHWKMV
jgi:methionyl-tRNA formyltransferase